MSLLDGGESPLATHIGHANILLFAPSGNGKTTTAGTMPGTVAYLSSEPQGALALKSKMIETGRDPNSIKIFDLTKRRVVEGKTISPRQYLDLLLDELERDPKDFTAVVLDSITDVQNSLVTQMKMAKGGLQKNLSQQEWGYIIDSTRNLCVRLRNLKLHTLVIALATETQDDQQRVIYRPNLVGKKLPQDIPQYFNLVCYMDKEWERGAKEEKFIARMRSSSNQIYTKGHQALDSEEVPDVSVWLDKLSKYWSSHGQESLPTKAEVTKEKTVEEKAEEGLEARIEQPEIKELFDKLKAAHGKRIASARKFPDDKELVNFLKSKIEEKGAA